ncbi:hypothetical protein C8R45DRAFT_924883 [Mycena sanguinolenta]|nr:hypothetical protein C8R45DRAFT_924883 [Mycena sanguinolenta]
MSNQQKSVLLLKLVLETCNATRDSAPQEPTSESLKVLHKDLVSLTSLLYAATTKLSLALKPSNPTYSASLTPLKDLADNLSALFHCSNLFIPEVHGATLVREVQTLVRDAIESIKALVQTFLDIETSDSRQGSGQAGDEYMVRTATVHNVLASARVLSSNNLRAVRKRWSEDAASLDDGFREAADMIEEAESTEDDFDDGEEFDDGWGDIGIGKSQKLNSEELDRSKKVHGILQLAQLMHTRILGDILATSQKAPNNSVLDSLSLLSHELLAASDELVSTLYAPQDPDRLKTELYAYRKIISDFQACLAKKPEALETQLQNLSLAPDGESKWFDTCFVQLSKVMDDLEDSLNPT